MDIRGASLLLLASLIVVLDQSVKALVLNWPRAGQTAWGWGVRIRPHINSEITRGMLRSSRAFAVLWLVVLVTLVALVEFAPGFQSGAAVVSLGVAAGGAGSNVLDRVRRGGIVDCFDAGFGRVFNLADAAIVIGSVSACVAYYFALAR